jgi:allene oxide cyclase-like protein
MRSKLRAGTASLLLLLGAGAAVASAGSSTGNGSSSSERRTSVLHLVGRDVDSAWLDLGATGNSLGDQSHFTSDLIQPPRPGVGPPPPGAGVPQEMKIGEDGGVCSIARIAPDDGATTYHCVATNSLPLGQITAQGLVTYAAGEDVRQEPYSFAITGGTRKYRAARGEVTIKDLSAEEVRITFGIIL